MRDGILAPGSLALGEVLLLLADLPDGGQGWSVHYTLFVRTGVTPAARAALEGRGGIVIDLTALAADLVL